MFEGKMYEKLKQDSLMARKTASRSAKFLITLLSEVKMRAKNDGDREPTQDDVVKTAQKFMKSAIETKGFLEKAGGDDFEPRMEINILERYLPQVMNRQETAVAVSVVVAETRATGMQDMGKVMGGLKKAHGNNIDMKLAGELFRSGVNG